MEEKKEFLANSMKLYTGVGFEDGLTCEDVAHLTANTPNRSIEQLIRASHKNGKKLTAKQLSTQKNEDVVPIPIGTDVLE